MKFKAAILYKSKYDLVVDHIMIKDKLKWGQVLIKINYSGICGSQINEIDAIKGPDNFLPHLLGHEGSGEVVEVGPGIKRMKVGDEVILHWRKGVGIESETPKYYCQNKIINAGSVFIGKYSTEAVGDYLAGTNHVLPTSGSAKFSSGLSVYDFYKRISYINLSKKGIETLGPSVITLANFEGLAGHAKSVELRIRRK